MELRPPYPAPERLTVSPFPWSPVPTFRDNHRELFLHLSLELSACDSKQNKYKIPAPSLSKDETLFSVFACACLPSDMHAGCLELSSSWGRLPSRRFFKRFLRKASLQSPTAMKYLDQFEQRGVSYSLLIASWKAQPGMFVWKKKYIELTQFEVVCLLFFF